MDSVNTDVTTHKFPRSMIILGAVVYSIMAIGLGLQACFIFIKAGANYLRMAWALAPAALSILMVFLIAHIVKISGSVLEVSDDGIKRKERDGKEVFIAWPDIGALKELGFMQQLVVHDRAGTKKIAVDYQFEGFDSVIGKRIVDEKEKYVQYAFPAVFGSGSIAPDYRSVFVMVFLSAMMYFTVFRMKNVELIQRIVISGVPLIAGFLLYLVDLLRSVRRISVDRTKFIVKTFLGEKSYAFSDVFFIEYRYRMQGSASLETELLQKAGGGGYRTPVLEVMMRSGKVMTFNKGCIPIMETYLCMLKAGGKGLLRVKSGLPNGTVALQE